MVAQIGDKKVEAGKVTGAGTGANANNTGKKIDAALKAELLQDLIDERKATGGNPIQAILLHQINRFLAGKKPETKLEEKVFAVLKTAPEGHTHRLHEKLGKDPSGHPRDPARSLGERTRSEQRPR